MYGICSLVDRDLESRIEEKSKRSNYGVTEE